MSDSLKVHSIESFGTHDGPGIRLVVFLQGCNLKCLYCHNPDTITTIGGTAHDINDLVSRAINMKPYFGKLGGVTVSGGEPLLQNKALIPFFTKLKQEGIQTNIDTNGTIFNDSIKSLLDDFTDLIMVDIKHTNEDGFNKITGAKNLDNNLQIINHREKSGKPFWLRYVLIPGHTDSPEELKALGERFRNYKHLEKIEIQPYHHLGIHKWEALGEKYQLKDIKENTKEQLERANEILTPYFKEVKFN